MTFEDSVSNTASLDEGWNAVAESGGGQSDPTVEAAKKILLDAVEASKAKSPEEAIRVITEAKNQAEDILEKEIEKLDEQEQHLYAVDRWDLTERQMHLLGAKRSIEKLAKQALYDRGCQDAKDWLADPNRAPLTSKDLDADYTRGFSETVKDYFEKVFRERGDACVPDDMFALGVVLAGFLGVSGLAGAVAVAAYEALYSAYLWGGVAFYNLLQKLGSGWQRLWNFFREKPPLRQAYETAVQNLQNKLGAMRAEGKSWEQIARTLNQARRDLGIKYKDMTPPDLLQKIYQRNIQRYGDKLGPTVDWFRAQNLSWEEIARKACRPGGADFGF